MNEEAEQAEEGEQPSAYDAIKAINWSTLKYIAVSPLNYRWRLKHPEPQKESFVIGGAIHCAILEPEYFKARYAVFDGVRNAKHEKWKTWQEEHPGTQALKPRELQLVEAVARAVLGHRLAGELLRGGRREEALTWIDEETGLACKGRLDYIRPDFLIDLKSAHDASPTAIERAMANYGYAAQLALYHDGAVASRRIPGDQRPYLIAVPKTPPYDDLVVYQVTAETLTAGRNYYRGLLRRLALCTEADYWPGLASSVVPLGLPAWFDGNQGISTETEEEF